MHIGFRYSSKLNLKVAQQHLQAHEISILITMLNKYKCMTNYDIKFCFNHSKHLAGLHNLFFTQMAVLLPHRRVNAVSSNLMHI